MSTNNPTPLTSDSLTNAGGRVSDLNTCPGSATSPSPSPDGLDGSSSRPLLSKESLSSKAYLHVKNPDYAQHWIARHKERCTIDQNGCWLWTGYRHPKGYGSTSYRNRSMHVHRAMYQAVHGVKLRPDEFVCHRCDVPSCCNPEHLFLGNNDINMADKTAKGRHHEMKVTHCPRGHAYDEENTYRWPQGRARNCKQCARIRQRIKAGWPEHLAVSLGKVPAGYTKESLR